MCQVEFRLSLTPTRLAARYIAWLHESIGTDAPNPLSVWLKELEAEIKERYPWRNPQSAEVHVKGQSQRPKRIRGCRPYSPMLAPAPACFIATRYFFPWHRRGLAFGNCRSDLTKTAISMIEPARCIAPMESAADRATEQHQANKRSNPRGSARPATSTTKPKIAKPGRIKRIVS